MRLKQIKLAGFKSFVDPTVVEFPSALVGVAGPNGSGKSNIVDAVRWVMGESSAKQLRGGQIADVIFNGSGGRQPLASAAVEMSFDNSAGRLGGEYAGWREIAIRRSVDREGVSGYFLNGTRCRRRDITDVFLGTGLGPRSYSIIEQGTISRLVESKPEELREFLEEAAGISRYKERRRETENRIGHTRENLDRVDDVLEELEKRLAHLRRQARAAERYREYKTDERRLRAELLALRIQAIETDLGTREEEAGERGLAVEAEVTREREIERDLAAARSEHEDALAKINRIQQRYFDLQTEIARLEEGLAGARRERELHSERLETIATRLKENESRAGEDENDAAKWQGESERLRPELDRAETRAREGHAERDRAEARAQALLEQDAAARERLAEARRELAVAEAGIEAAQERASHLARRSERLTEERSQLENRVLDAAGDAARSEATSLRERAVAADVEVANAEEAVRGAGQSLREASAGLADTRRDQASVAGRLESLEALVQAGQGGEAIGNWLSEKGMADAERLAATLSIESGWEQAVELVLGDWLEAFAVPSAGDGLAIALNELQAGRLGFAERGEVPEPPAGSLAAHVRADFPVLHELLGCVLTAESFEEALRSRSALAPGQSLITRDGLWCGQDWLRVTRAMADSGQGILEREQEQRRLTDERDRLAEQIERAEVAQSEAERNLEQSEAAYAQARVAAREVRDELAQALTREAQADSRELGARERLEALAREIDELAGQASATGDEIEVLRVTGSEAREACARLESEAAPLTEALNEARAAAAAARATYEALHGEREGLAIRLESARVQGQAAAATVQRLREESESLAVERGRLQGRLDEMDDPGEALQRQLETALDGHRAVNDELAAARDAAAVIERRVGEQERARHAASNRVSELREGLESARLSAQELKTRREGIAEQLSDLDADAAALLDAIEEGADAEEWERRLEKVSERIQRLGAINLTAIDECEAEAQREDYLKQQRADLAEALTTLEDAIRKIDRETRERFRETFDRVNTRMRDLFQRLFGGGTAELVLTGTELLDAGVHITARPPGKKNATIQMLSGGEKALVAVALVFAIFELNPAPFCLLDEVDAPMDDANVDRFCDLVRDLSATTQFVLITHNRRTMALCHQLIGVTMQEPGVSRLVGVDVDEAEKLATA